ncbi:hypothetical protein IIB49_02180, partial [Patescibacteria group bacterium]|nr:hypothetical protein [Patescibacteria group bacterium]
LSITTKEESSRAVLNKRLGSQKAFSDIIGLKEGEYVVHLDHGVARFAGFTNDHTTYQILDTTYYILEYALGDKLFLPQGLEKKLSRYVGFGEPKVSRLGSPFWVKTKRRINYIILHKKRK